MRHFVVTGIAATMIIAACGGASTQPPVTASAPQQTPIATAAAVAPTSARGTASGTLNITLSGGLTGTLSEVRSVLLCSDPTKTGYAASFQSSLAGVAYSLGIGIGTTYKGPGTYATGTDATVSVRGATIREIWDSIPGGAITVAADGSGTVDADLKNATGAPSVHAKGTFACKR